MLLPVSCVRNGLSPCRHRSFQFQLTNLDCSSMIFPSGVMISFPTTATILCSPRSSLTRHPRSLTAQKASCCQRYVSLLWHLTAVLFASRKYELHSFDRKESTFDRHTHTHTPSVEMLVPSRMHVKGRNPELYGRQHQKSIYFDMPITRH
jgi:hypothetical protein